MSEPEAEQAAPESAAARRLRELVHDVESMDVTEITNQQLVALLVRSQTGMADALERVAAVREADRTKAEADRVTDRKESRRRWLITVVGFVVLVVFAVLQGVGLVLIRDSQVSNHQTQVEIANATGPAAAAAEAQSIVPAAEYIADGDANHADRVRAAATPGAVIPARASEALGKKLVPCPPDSVAGP